MATGNHIITHKNHTWSRFGLVLSMLLVLFALTGWLVIGNCEMWFADYRQTEPRPATIKMVALRIDSNIMRAQAIMENLVYSDGPLELANDVKGLDQLVEVIYKDFQAMGEQFPGDNSQYQKALASFSEWKSVRDEAIGLTAAGPSLRAKEMVRGKSAAHVQEIRAALMALNRFSEKRALD